MNDIAPIQDIDHATDPQLPALRPPVFTPLASQGTREVCTALAMAQGQFRAPKRTKTATVKLQGGGGYTFNYAPLEEIIDATKEGLAQNALARHQYLATRGDQPIIRTIIWHSSGEWIASDYPIHPSKEGAQGFASGVTFARRYGLCLALGLAPEDDDDANLAEGNQAQTTDAAPSRKSTAKKGEIQSLREPPKVPAPEVFDPETGEVTAMKPHRLEVPMTAKGGRDWPVWGAKLIGAFAGAQTLEELRSWEALNTDEIHEVRESAPRVFKSTQGAYEKAFARLGPPADFMPADESADPPR